MKKRGRWKNLIDGFQDVYPFKAEVVYNFVSKSCTTYYQKEQPFEGGSQRFYKNYMNTSEKIMVNLPKRENYEMKEEKMAATIN